LTRRNQKPVTVPPCKPQTLTWTDTGANPAPEVRGRRLDILSHGTASRMFTTLIVVTNNETGNQRTSPDASSSSFCLFTTESCRNVSNISAIFAGLSICHSVSKNPRTAGRNCTGFDIAKFSLNEGFVKTAQKRKLFINVFLCVSLTLFDT
jgi:hypothetical protein